MKTEDRCTNDKESGFVKSQSTVATGENMIDWVRH